MPFTTVPGYCPLTKAGCLTDESICLPTSLQEMTKNSGSCLLRIACQVDRLTFKRVTWTVVSDSIFLHVDNKFGTNHFAMLVSSLESGNLHCDTACAIISLSQECTPEGGT